MEKVKRVRINMRVPADLVQFIKEYTARNGTTMTGDYVEYLTKKWQEDEKSVGESE